MEVYVFEMETKIASLGEELSAICSENEAILSRNEDLASQLVSVSEKLNASKSEMDILHEEVTSLVRLSLPFCSAFLMSSLDFWFCNYPCMDSTCTTLNL